MSASDPARMAGSAAEKPVRHHEPSGIRKKWLALVEANGHGRVVDDPLRQSEQADELLLMGLRLREGIDLARYAALAGRDLDPVRIASLAAEDMSEVRHGRLRVTAGGFAVLDAIVADLAV